MDIIILPGISSGLGSLYLIPKVTAPGDWWITFSAFSMSYVPGAKKPKENTMSLKWKKKSKNNAVLKENISVRHCAQYYTVLQNDF